MSPRLRRPNRAAFTLVELLVVITIIGVLAAALLPAAFRAVERSRVTAISFEITQLAQAIEAYKTKKGDYPPDFSNLAAISNHLLKSYRGNTVNINTLQAAPFATLDPSEALVFWLSRSALDPRNPFNASGDRAVYFDFKPERLDDLDADGWQEYYPPNTKDAPYVYFDGRAQQAVTAAGQSVATSAYFYAVYPPTWSPRSGAPSGSRPPTVLRSGNAPAGDAASPIGLVRPYRSNTQIGLALAPADPSYPGPVASGTPPTEQNDTAWVAVGKFQIVTSGMDGRFGVDNINSNSEVTFKKFPVPNYYFGPIDRSSDEDNITNFSEGKLVDKIP